MHTVNGKNAKVKKKKKSRGGSVGLNVKKTNIISHIYVFIIIILFLFLLLTWKLLCREVARAHIHREYMQPRAAV